MASTYTPTDAINMAKALNHQAPTVNMQTYAADLINSFIWVAFPWTWTRKALTTISLTDGTQDYALNSANATDFYRFVNLELNQTSTTPNVVRALSQKNHLSQELVTTGGIETIRHFSWEPSISKIRLDYPAAVPSGVTIVIQGEYQYVPTKITESTLTTALTLPDHYFHVFLEGVRWKFYELTDDPRTGTTQEVRGRAVHTGQKATFMAAFDAMKEAEDFSDAEDVVYPAGGTLGQGRDNFNPKIFF